MARSISPWPVWCLASPKASTWRKRFSFLSKASKLVSVSSSPPRVEPLTVSCRSKTNSLCCNSTLSSAHSSSNSLSLSKANQGAPSRRSLPNSLRAAQSLCTAYWSSMMSATVMISFHPFRISFKRKEPLPKGSRFPLSLTGTEWVALKELVSSPAYLRYKAFLDNYAELRAQRLLQPLSLDATNTERGAVAAIFEIAVLPEAIIKHVKELDDARERNAVGADDAASHLGE